MAKKIIIFIAVVLLTVTATLLTIDAINLGVEDEFVPIETDKFFMLDSPLFTHEYESETFTKPTSDEIEAIKASMSEAQVDANYKAGPENDQFALFYRHGSGKNQGGAIRLINKETGYVWSSDIFGLDTSTINRDFFQRIISPFKVIIRDFAGSSINLTSTAFNNVAVTLDGNTLHYVASHKMTKEIETQSMEMNIAFEFDVTLTDTGINIHMPVDKISESNCKIFEISFFPYLGAVLEDEVNGYIAIPNGNGGLIKYGKTSPLTSAYMTHFYGTDYNYPNNYTKQLFSMPMFGMVHGVDKDACLVEIDSGDSFAAFNYSPTGLSDTNGYHLSYLTFELRHHYEIETSPDKFITMIPDDHYQTNIDFSYNFLSDDKANYVGIAKTYQEHLVKKGRLVQQELAHNTSVHVEAFGREYEKGLILNKYHNMTIVSDLLNINEFLRAGGASDVLYTLKGFYKGGYSASDPTKIKVDKALGNLDNLEDFNYYLYYNPVLSMSERLTPPSYVLVNVTRKNTYKMIEELAKYHYYSSVPTIIEGTQKAIERYGDKVSFDGVTNYLYGDYNNEMEREDTLAAYTQLFGDKTYPMYAPNAYLYKNSSAYLAMDLYHESLKIVTDSVPLTQIVLRGYMDLYSTYLNFSTNPELDMLKCIEYGVYPSYLITKQPSHLLSKTLSNDLYATEFSRISESMLDQYDKIKTQLDQVIGYQIVDREVIRLGVVKVTYSNGVNTKDIVVNYTQTPETVNSRIVNPMSSEVIDNA